MAAEGESSLADFSRRHTAMNIRPLQVALQPVEKCQRLTFNGNCLKVISSRQNGTKRISQNWGYLMTKHVAEPGVELKLLLNIGSYDLSLKGQVRHVDPPAGMGIEFYEIRKGDRQILQFLLRKLFRKAVRRHAMF